MCAGNISGDTTPKARKRYWCQLCGVPIEPGVIHTARRGVFEGEAVTCRMHSDCVALTADWTNNDWENYDEYEFRKEKEATLVRP